MTTLILSLQQTSSIFCVRTWLLHVDHLSQQTSQWHLPCRPRQEAVALAQRDTRVPGCVRARDQDVPRYSERDHQCSAEAARLLRLRRPVLLSSSPGGKSKRRADWPGDQRILGQTGQD